MKPLSPFQEQVRDLLEEVFVEAWGKITPVKLSHKPSYPRVPYVQLSTIWGGIYKNKADGKPYHSGFLFVGIIFPPDEGMEYGLGLANQAVEILKFKTFKKDLLVVNCEQANVGCHAHEHKRYCYVLVKALFKAEENS